MIRPSISGFVLLSLSGNNFGSGVGPGIIYPAMNRSYSKTQLKPLISLTGNKCEFAGCNFQLSPTSDQFFGIIAHISGLNEGSARFDASMDDSKRNSNGNLIVLCPNHHAMVDCDPNRFGVAELTSMKLDHEMKVREEHKEFKFDERLLEKVTGGPGVTQANFQLGSGTQIITQHVNYAAHELAGEKDRARANITSALSEIKRAMREGATRDMVPYAADIANTAFNALKWGDPQLFNKCVDEMKRTVEFSLTGEQPRTKQRQNLNEYLLFSCYGLGVRCLELSDFEALKYLLNANIYLNRGSSPMVRCLSVEYFRAKEGSDPDLFRDASNHITTHLAEKFAWEEKETKVQMAVFEFLGATFTAYHQRHVDFPLTGTQYSAWNVVKQLDRLIGDKTFYAALFGDLKPERLANSMVAVSQALSGRAFLQWSANELTEWDGPTCDFIRANQTQQ